MIIAKCNPEGCINIETAKGFEQTAFEFENLVRSFAVKYSLNSSEEDDLFQEGMIALYKAFISYGASNAKFSTYASVCIKNSMISWIRKNRNSVFLPFDDVDESALTSDSISENPEEFALHNDFVSSFMTYAHSCLSEFECKVFDFAVKDYSCKEIAKELSVQPKVVENAMFRIRRKLRFKITESSL